MIFLVAEDWLQFLICHVSKKYYIIIKKILLEQCKQNQLFWIFYELTIYKIQIVTFKMYLNR